MLTYNHESTISLEDYPDSLISILKLSMNIQYNSWCYSFFRKPTGAQNFIPYKDPNPLYSL